MENEWLRNVLVSIKEEVENLRLTIVCLRGGKESPCGVSTGNFIQKNKDKVKKLKEF